MGRRFPELLDPRTLPAGGVLVLSPHPDDETIGCGGALALHASRGDDVRVLFATDGDAGDRDGRFGGRLAAIRREEASRACAVLRAGAPAFLGLPDGGLEGHPRLTGLLAETIRAFSPAVLYAPSFFEIHPDHRAVSAAAAAAACETRFGGRFFLYEIGGALEPTCLLDITPHAEVKRRALQCYASQATYNDLATKAMQRAGGRAINVDLEGVLGVEAFLEIRAQRYGEARRRHRALLDALGIDPGGAGDGA